MSSEISAIVRLRKLPPLFRGSDLSIQFEWTPKTASQYLYLWKQRELVEPLGGKSDVFANVLFHPDPDWNSALKMAMPSAVVVGLEALRLAGWITQTPTQTTVAVDRSQPVFKTSHFEVLARKATWFETVKPGLCRNISTLPILKPAWALADLLRERDWGECGLTPEEINWDLVDEKQLTSACTCLGVPLGQLDELGVSSR